MKREKEGGREVEICVRREIKIRSTNCNNITIKHYNHHCVRTMTYVPKKVVTVSDTLNDALWNAADGLGSFASMTYVFVKDWRGGGGGGGT